MRCFDPNDPPQVTYDGGLLLVQLDILARKAAKESLEIAAMN
jgi:hypothetical protein